jgi:hypothetical protein
VRLQLWREVWAALWQEVLVGLWRQLVLVLWVAPLRPPYAVFRLPIFQDRWKKRSFSQLQWVFFFFRLLERTQLKLTTAQAHPLKTVARLKIDMRLRCRSWGTLL